MKTEIIEIIVNTAYVIVGMLLKSILGKNKK